MKKFTLLLVLLLAVVGVKADGYEGTSVWYNESGTAISWDSDSYTGIKFDTSNQNVDMSSVVKNSTIYVYYTDDNYDGPQHSLSYKAGAGWNWTTLSGFTVGSTYISYTVATHDIAKYIAARGIIVTGIGYKITRITIAAPATAETFTDTDLNKTTTFGDWDWQKAIRLDKGNGAVPACIQGAKLGDEIAIGYSVAASTEAQFQICDDSWTMIEGASISFASGDAQSGTFTFRITDNYALECIQYGGIIIHGKNASITSVVFKASSINDGDITSVNLNITSAGIATFSSYKNLDFSGLNNVTAYYASSVDTEKKQVTMKKVTKARAGTGLYIVGEEGTYDIPICSTEGLDEITSNALIAVVTASDVAASTSGSYNYILAANKTGDANPGFYKLTAQHNLKKHKAYLQTTSDITPTTVEGARVALIFDDEATTSIQTVEKKQVVNDNVYYTLSGQRVQNPTRGLYIVNGKKVIIK